MSSNTYVNNCFIRKRSDFGCGQTYLVENKTKLRATKKETSTILLHNILRAWSTKSTICCMQQLADENACFWFKIARINFSEESLKTWLVFPWRDINQSEGENTGVKIEKARKILMNAWISSLWKTLMFVVRFVFLGHSEGSEKIPGTPSRYHSLRFS